MAYVGPIAWYVSSVAQAAVTAWASNVAKSAAALVRQNAAPAVGAERVFAALNGGNTTNGAEPTWTTTKGGKTTDNTITWIEVTGQPGVNGDITNTPRWTVSSTPAQGLIIYDSVTLSLQVCQTSAAGGTGAAPSFSATAGTVTADASASWVSLGLASNFAAWAAPFAREQSLVGAGWMQAGDSGFYADNHAETQSVSMSVTFPGTNALPNLLYSVDHTLSVPPTGVKSGASLTTTGASSITYAGSFYRNGMTINCGSGANSAGFVIANSVGAWEKFVNCTLAKLGTVGNNNAYNLGNSSRAYVEFSNTTVQFGAIGDGITVLGQTFLWKNTPTAIQGATFPTTLFGQNVAIESTVILESVDLSAFSGSLVTAGNGGAAYLYLMDCKLNASMTIVTPTNRVGAFIDVVNSGSAANNYQQSRTRYEGSLAVSTTVVRTGGASAGTPMAWLLTTTANAQWVAPFISFPIAIWNTLTGANRTVTIYGIVNAAAVPNNDQIWVDVEYAGSASSPQGSFANSTKASNLASGATVTADSASAWDSGVTARANSQAYTAGTSIIKLASNPGRVFFCTTSGTSAGSEPGGYASAVDGGSVTDGTAVFRAGCRFSLAVTLSSPQPQLTGYIKAEVRVGQASASFYVDPLLNLS